MGKLRSVPKFSQLFCFFKISLLFEKKNDLNTVKPVLSAHFKEGYNRFSRRIIA